MNLTPNIFPAYPPSLPLPDHVHGFVALNRSPRRLEFSKALLGVDAAFDRSVILLQDIVQVLHRSVPTAAAKDSFLLYAGDGRAVDRRPIRVDDARLRMGRMAERLAKQAFGGVGVAQPRKQEINRGSGGIDGPIQVAPAVLHSNVGLVHAPGFVGWLQVPPYPLLQFGTITLYPTPNGGVVCLQAAFLKKLFDIPK